MFEFPVQLPGVVYYFLARTEYSFLLPDWLRLSGPTPSELPLTYAKSILEVELIRNFFPGKDDKDWD